MESRSRPLLRAQPARLRPPATTSSWPSKLASTPTPAPLGFLEAGGPADYAGDLPLILKLNNRENLASDADPLQAVTGSVEAALRLGCAAIGYTVYPGSAPRVQMYEKLQALAEEAKRHGLVVVGLVLPPAART